MCGFKRYCGNKGSRFRLQLNRSAPGWSIYNYSSQTVDSLNLYELPSKPHIKYADETDNIVSKFKTHPDIVKVKKHFKIKTTFSFSPLSKDEIVAIIVNLQNNKAAAVEILLSILKKSNFTFDESTECVNYTLKNGKFPDSIKKC